MLFFSGSVEFFSIFLSLAAVWLSFDYVFVDAITFLGLEFSFYRAEFVDRHCLNLVLSWNISLSMLTETLLNIVVWAGIRGLLVSE